MKVILECDYCEKAIKKYQCKVTKHNFCSRECKNKYSSKKFNPEGYKKYRDFSKNSKRMTKMNKELNPSRMTPEVRVKLRSSHLDTGKGLSYKKLYGRHEHRVVAERMLGRKLNPGEIVHHIDGDKRNNDPENLIVMKNQSEHLEWHLMLDDKYSKGGDA